MTPKIPNSKRTDKKLGTLSVKKCQRHWFSAGSCNVEPVTLKPYSFFISQSQVRNFRKLSVNYQSSTFVGLQKKTMEMNDNKQETTCF